MLHKYIEENLITQQFQNFTIARPIINQELKGIFGTETLRDFKEIINLYNYYENGVKFIAEGMDYTPSDHRFKTIKTLIDKEARFLFSIAPTISVNDPKGNDDRVEQNQLLVQKVLQDNHFESRLVRAARDCLIGKRIAIAVDFNDNGINLSFMPSLEFIYETDPTDIDKMTKFIRFYSVVENDEKNQQRVYKKKWELEDDGFVYISEEIYDGHGTVVETIMQRTKSEFRQIPVKVIINGGLIGDPYGISDIEALLEDEEWYNKLSAKDFDSLRKGADQIVYAMDLNPESTKDLSRSAGAFWDVASDPTADGKQGKLGVIENSMAYSAPLDTSLKRLRAAMFSSLDIPDTTSEALQGIISSGKTMKAIYWGLLVRCDEKMLDWKPALTEMVQTIIEGAKLYPNAKSVYIGTEKLADEYNIVIDNSYPILEDEDEEKTTDMNQVNNNVMSRKSYMKKWFNMNDSEINAELEQIALEKAMFEQDNYFGDTGE